MASASKDAHLYGAPRPKKATGKEITSSGTLAFSSALSSLLTAPSTTATTSSRSRTQKAKDDIFSTHNRNTKKRAAADMLSFEDDSAKLKGAHMDEASWRRTKRKMEEKARLYAAMKRGDVEDENEKHMVDFDRKWAENGGHKDADTSSDDSGDEEPEELVEYLDEFGRMRRGTRGEAAREERRKQMGEKYRAESDLYSARPSAPTNIIYGDTVQAAAFNPDEPVVAQMEELAKKRDRELTPPQAMHYDAEKEVRNKGTGFFQFSKDEEEREAQMQELEKERQETEKVRAEKAGGNRKEERRKAVEEKRRLIREKRGRVQADKFLADLGQEMAEKDDANNT